MRNQILHGYVIHHRKYRERSHIAYLFTEQYGRIDGMLRQQNAPPQYQPLSVQATGKNELKNFNKLEILHQPVFLHGDAFFAGFYLNELLLKLCPLEVPMPHTFLQYSVTLNQLQKLAQQSQPNLFLRQILRQFEHSLLHDLGYAIDFSVDCHQNSIQVKNYYTFQLNEGFIPCQSAQLGCFWGQQILTMQQYKKDRDFNLEQLQLLSKLYRQVIAILLGNRPLKSRQLWVQS